MQLERRRLRKQAPTLKRCGRFQIHESCSDSGITKPSTHTGTESGTTPTLLLQKCEKSRASDARAKTSFLYPCTYFAIVNGTSHVNWRGTQHYERFHLFGPKRQELRMRHISTGGIGLESPRTTDLEKRHRPRGSISTCTHREN